MTRTARTLAALLLLGALALAPRALAQICGGNLRFVVNNESGKAMTAEELAEAKVDIKPGFCGGISKGTVTFRGKTMVLLFRGIPELNNRRYLVHLPPFAEGTFEADFAPECDAAQEDSRTCFVAASRWKRVEPQARTGQF